MSTERERERLETPSALSLIIRQQSVRIDRIFACSQFFEKTSPTPWLISHQLRALIENRIRAIIYRGIDGAGSRAFFFRKEINHSQRVATVRLRSVDRTREKAMNE